MNDISWIQANWRKQYRARKNHQKIDLDFWPMTLIFSRVLEVVKIHIRAKFHQNFIKLSATVHELSRSQSFDDAENNIAVTFAGTDNW